MKDFFALTTQGKVNRMRPAMRKALAQYDIQVKSLKLLGTATNIIMRVDTTTGTPYLLRTAIPGWRTELDNLSEMIWLDAMSNTDIGAPKPIQTKDGKWLVHETAEGLPCSYRMCLQSWVYGQPLENDLTTINLYKMGELFAKIHQFSLGFQPPETFTKRKMAHYLSRDEENDLASETHRKTYQGADWQLIDAVHERVMEAFKKRYANPSGFRVIHNDLWHGNIQVYRGRLFPIDFEDTLWGYPVQDIAMAIQDLDDDGPRSEFEALYNAFKNGYCSHLEWPEQYEGEIDSFRAGRMLWVINWVLGHQEKYFTQHVNRISPILKTYLQTGKVRFPVE